MDITPSVGCFAHIYHIFAYLGQSAPTLQCISPQGGNLASPLTAQCTILSDWLLLDGGRRVDPGAMCLLAHLLCLCCKMDLWVLCNVARVTTACIRYSERPSGGTMGRENKPICTTGLNSGKDELLPARVERTNVTALP